MPNGLARVSDEKGLKREQSIESGDVHETL